MMKAAQIARERGIPYFGICYGFQWAAVEYARGVCGLSEADSTECSPDAEHKVIYKLRDLLGVDDLGGTMRLGQYECVLAPGSLGQKIYGATTIFERHRHRYEFNCLYEPTLIDKGLRISGKSPDGKFVEMIELPGHPWYIAVQFHPEFKSKPLRPHPLFASFVEASHRHKTADWRRHDRQRQASSDVRHQTGGGRKRRPSAGGAPLALIAGPCVIESADHAAMIAESLVKITSRCGVPFIFKASYDKANRTSLKSFRGPGIEEGLKVLAGIKQRLGVPVLTDIHEAHQAAPVAEVADVLQIPAFLSRQTDLIVAAARTGRTINLKKGQFLAPADMRHAIAKVTESGNSQVFVTERGFSFGYNNLVVDMRAFPMLRSLGYPVVYDATHSLQLPGGGDGVTAGQAEYIEPLASAAVAAGIDGLFVEVHDNPPRAKSDAQNALALERLEPLLRHLLSDQRRSPSRGSDPRQDVYEGSDPL